MRANAGQEKGKTDTSVVISLAGRVSITANGAVVDEERFPGRQGRLVFAYLATEAGRPIPRDELAEALWRGVPPPTWEKALTVIVSKLRALLEECGVDGSKALTGAFGCYRLDLPEGSSVDVVMARRAVEDRAASEDDLARAAEIAGSPFLPGDESDWAERQQRELANVRVRALERLADASLASADHAEAARLAQKVVELEPYRESGYRRLMQAHAAAGNRAEGLRVYERCRQFLADELGAYPSPETESIYRELLAAPAAPATKPTRQAPRSPAPPPAASRSRWSARRAAVLAVGLVIVGGSTVAAMEALSGGGADIQTLASERCSPLDWGGRGKPDFIVAADLPLQRDVLALTRPMADALRVALEQRNYRAGRFNVGLQVCDDATPTESYSEATCAENARAFASTPSVIGVVGPFTSGCAAIEIPILNQAPAGPLAIVSPTNTLVALTRANSDNAPPANYYPTGRRNYARILAPDDVQAAADAILARKLGVHRVYVLNDVEAYGAAMAKVFDRTARKLRVAVVGRASWDREATSYAALATRIAKAHADGVFLSGASNANGVALITDLRGRLGRDVQIMAPDGFDPAETATAGGTAAEGMTMSRAGIPNEQLGKAGKQFAASFANKVGAPPTGFATDAAQAMDVLLDAIARSDGTRASVTRNLFSTRISNGILGTFWITSTGDTTLNAVTIFRIVGGKVATYDTITVPGDLLART